MTALAVSPPGDEAALAPSYSLISSPLVHEAPAVEGTISGRVIEEGSGRALAGAQIEVVGEGLGTLAGADGRFTISGVPAGEVTVRVQILGYASRSQTVTLTSGETVELDFRLTQQALALDEVVVTGTAGGAQRRAIGNVVDRISAADVMEVAPVTNMSQLIGQRTPGVMLLGTAGQVGAGSRIRIRGTSSIGLSNDPIIYIDGIRMDSEPNRGPSQRGGARVSRLDDLDPESIESIEIIKGPAAATLYGTEASAGVIQIITKRGASGSPFSECDGQNRDELDVEPRGTGGRAVLS
jgi:TonB-dependent starch-binding outer membrane protein SusC